jgi:hypothetical protein
VIAPSSCPSALRLAHWEAGGPDSNDDRQQMSEHVRGCARCGGLAEELDVARRELLIGDPSALLAAQRIAFAVAERYQDQRRRRWHMVGWVSARAVAVAALLVVVAPHVHVPPRESTIATAVQEPGVWAKGRLVVEAFCKRGESVFRVEDGAALLAGDRLRFAYTAPQDGHLMVFGVDDGGQLFPYYGEGALASIAVGAGASVMLPGSVELDNHHGVERVFALWSPTPVDAAGVRRAVAQALASGDIARATRLNLPADQVSYLLKRP